MANSKAFPLNGGEYEFIDCTAIAVSAEDTERQAAVLIHKIGDTSGDSLGLFFGCTVEDLPGTSKEIENVLFGEWISSYEEDLKTVLVDGQPLNYLIFN